MSALPPASTVALSRLRLLVGASAVSALGSGVASLAFSYISYKISGSLVIAVIVLALQSVPSAILMRISAGLALRFDLRHIVAVADLAKFLLYVVVCVLVLRGYLSLSLLMATALVSGSISALAYPAWNQLLRSIAPPDGLDRLDASFSSWGAVAGIVGVLLGGQMLDTLGASSLFLFNAVSYLAPMAAALVLPAIRSSSGGSTTPKTRLRDAGRLLFTMQTLRRIVVLSILLELVAWPILKLFPRIATDVDPSAQTFSLLLGAFYLGNAGVAIVLVRGKKRYGYQALMVAALLLLAVALVLMWLSALLPEGVAHVVVLMIVIAPIGLALSLVATVISASVQLGAPADKEIQILAVYAAAVTLVAPVGGLIITGLVGLMDIWLVVALEAVGVTVLIAYAGWPTFGKDLRSYAERDPRGDVLRWHGRHLTLGHIDHGRISRAEGALSRDEVRLLHRDREFKSRGGQESQGTDREGS